MMALSSCTTADAPTKIEEEQESNDESSSTSTQALPPITATQAMQEQQSRRDATFRPANTTLIDDCLFFGHVVNDGDSAEFDPNRRHSFSDAMWAALRNSFGLSTFRRNQGEAITAALLGRDCFIVKPTGGGKSLCFQLPAVVDRGVTIVISPLKSLMADQLAHLAALDIRAGVLSGDTSDEEQYAIRSEFRQLDPQRKLVYMAPEKLFNKYNDNLINELTALAQCGMLARIVVDEAHCISDWGCSFRPAFRRIIELRERMPTVPMMALTATANRRVQRDILQQLGMTGAPGDGRKRACIFVEGFDRPNLCYNVSSKRDFMDPEEDSMREVAELIVDKHPGQCGIVYCLSKKETEEVADALREAGVKARHYHSEVPIPQKQEVQRQWINGEIDVAVATTALGMGIDKPDVRFVIHYSAPKSIECYYQQVGRAGRDGQPAFCTLLFNDWDVRMWRELTRMQGKKPMSEASKRQLREDIDAQVDYCKEKSICRRRLLLTYFGQLYDPVMCMANPETACDNCRNANLRDKLDVTVYARQLAQFLHNAAMQTDGAPLATTRVTPHQLIDALVGSVHTNRHDADACLDLKPIFKVCAGISRNLIVAMVQDMRQYGYIEYYESDLEAVGVTDGQEVVEYVRVGEQVGQLLHGGARVEIYELSKEGEQQRKDKIKRQEELDKISDECQTMLKRELHDMRCEHGGNDEICSLDLVWKISRFLPEADDELRAVDGVAEPIFNRIGGRFLAITKRQADRVGSHLKSTLADRRKLYRTAGRVGQPVGDRQLVQCATVFAQPSSAPPSPPAIASSSQGRHAGMQLAPSPALPVKLDDDSTAASIGSAANSSLDSGLGEPSPKRRRSDPSSGNDAASMTTKSEFKA